MSTTDSADMGDVGPDRRRQVMVGDLPQGFLTVGGSPVMPQHGHPQQQVMLDQQTAAAMQASQPGFAFVSPNMARLSITVAQAKLNKNYGLMKMDTYCRLRIGHSVFETHTANGGGKNPRWNKVMHCHVPQGVDSIYLEIFDEHAFTTDDRVAWAHVPISEKVFNNEAVDDWFHLNGRQGDGKEGIINLCLSYTKVAAAPPVVYQTGVAPMMMVPGGMPVYSPQVGGVPVMVQSQQQCQQPVAYQPAQPAQPAYTEEDVQQVKDMFPNIEEEVIRSVFEANRGNKEATISNLLSMNS